MEKRFFIATALSLFVLLAWGRFFAPQTPPPERLDSEIIENNNLTRNAPPSFEDNDAPTMQEEIIGGDGVEVFSAKKPVSEKGETLESEKLLLTFSNVGGALKSVFVKDYGVEMPITKVIGVEGFENAGFVIENKSDEEIIFSYEDDDFLVRRIFHPSKDDYIVIAKTIIRSKSKMSKNINVSTVPYMIDMSSLDNSKGGMFAGGHARDKSLYEYVVNSYGGVERKNNAYKFNKKKEDKVHEGGVFWFGFRTRYFAAIIKPEYDISQYRFNVIDEEKMKISAKIEQVTINPGNSISLDHTMFFGPENTALLKKYDMNFEDIKRYYRFPLFDIIAKLINSLMHVMYRVVPNWGICIILVCFVIYFTTYPMTMRSMQSMKKMQEVQPRIAQLRDKHKDNPQKLNAEMLKIYKEEKVNPLGGCLPMILQMPVFVGLYQVLLRNVSFKGAEFLWIKDLSEPDRFYIIGSNLPFIGNEINLLPLLMMVIMVFQMKLQSGNMVAADPAQQAQQKMMRTIMPVFIGAIFYKFSSGLTLYFTLYYTLSTLSHLVMSKKNSKAK